MILSDVKTAVASMLQTTTGGLTVNSQDLFLVAANNVRRNAQLRHNFELCRTSATLTIDGQTGGDLGSASFTTNNAVLVSGTLTPDVTGYYKLLGNPSDPVTAFSANVYTKIVGTRFMVVFKNNTEYEILDNFTGSPLWVKASTVSVEGSYTASTGATGTATVAFSNGILESIKEILSISRVNSDNSRTPLDYTRLDLQRERDRSEQELDTFNWWEQRYPSDATRSVGSSIAQIVQRGTKLFIYPLAAPDQTTSDADLAVELEVQCWLRDYVTADLSDSAATDFFCSYGHQYLMWAIICELNYRFKIFVPRTEGELSPPEKMMAMAWNDLLLWDTYAIDNNVTRSR